MNNTEPIIQLEKITFGYPGRPPVLNQLDLEFSRGERMGLMAPNGCGKTTLFHIIMGLLKPSSGSIKIFGTDIRTDSEFNDVRRRIGLLFQDADDQLFSPTVLEDVAFGPLNQGKSKDEAIAIAKKTLSSLNLAGFEDRITFKLSGGEKRLVSLATVLAMEPEVLLLDEPLNGLDIETRSKITEIITGLDLSFILISHDFDFLTSTTDAVYSMNAGKIQFDDQVQVHVHRHAHSHGVYPHEHE